MSHDRGVLAALAISTFIALGVASVAIDAQAPRTVQDGVYSDTQATRGQGLYAQRCAGCHGPALGGAQAPPLAGEAFTAKWRMEPLSALFIKIRYTMPPSVPPSVPPGGGLSAAPAPAAPQLTPEQGADLVAHVLKTNGVPAGQTDFAAADAVTSTISWPAGSAAVSGAATSTARIPTGTLNQLMRGVFFPNSNLIFTVQEMDPVNLPPQPPPSRPEGLTIFDWGQQIYTGWPVVENAAAALADASMIMIQPGLRCENGRLAPVTEPDWIRFTDRMIAVARRTYRLAQTRDKEAVSEYTTELSNTCNACHLVYRDLGGRGRGRGAGAGNPTGPNSARCTHR